MAKSKTGAAASWALAMLGALSVIVGIVGAGAMALQFDVAGALQMLALGIVCAAVLLGLSAIIELLREISGAVAAKGGGLPGTPADRDGI